jgi:hypothetical protein
MQVVTDDSVQFEYHALRKRFGQLLLKIVEERKKASLNVQNKFRALQSFDGLICETNEDVERLNEYTTARLEYERINIQCNDIDGILFLLEKLFHDKII